MEDYAAKRNRIIEVLNGTDASFEFKNKLISKYSDQYKGWESQRSNRYDPESIPSYRVAVDEEGNVIFATNKQIQIGGLSPVESTRGGAARGRPGQKFFTLAYEISANREDKDKFMAVVNKIFDEGLLGITDADEAKIVQEILREINLRAQKREESGLSALKALLEGENTQTNVGDESELQARMRVLKAAGLDRETVRAILIKEGLLDG